MGWSSFAPAKVNLSLHVGPPRADGRHPLDSLVAFADVGDRIAVRPGPELRLSIDGPFGAALRGEADNLVLTAARALRAAMGHALGAEMSLTKELPLASGIGGGSADAAATLRALAKLWRFAGSTADLLAIARPLGGDMPACILSRPLRMTDDGAEVEPLELPPLDGVLVNPGAPSPTGPVYRAYDADPGGGGLHGAPVGPWSDAAALRRALAAARNDLEAPAARLTPAIAEVLSALRSDGSVAVARVSGSGATCFALVDGPDAAQALARRLADRAQSWWVRPVRLGAVDVTPAAL